MVRVAAKITAKDVLCGRFCRFSDAECCAFKVANLVDNQSLICRIVVPLYISGLVCTYDYDCQFLMRWNIKCFIPHVKLSFS